VSESLGHTLGSTYAPERKEPKSRDEPMLVIGLECDRPLASSTRHAIGDVDELTIGRGRDRESLREVGAWGRRLALRIPDRWMSSAHARIAHSFGRWVFEDLGSKNGSAINGREVNRQPLQDGDVIELGHTLLLFRERVPSRPEDARDLDAAGVESMPGLVTLRPDLARDLDKLRQLAPSTVSLLLLGESGTGKEVIARAIAALSNRPGEFVAVNCGAIPDTLIESELFGHKKGAFSGATADSPGLVRSAHRGTLFLDEIADLPPPSQAALLRVLQEREVRPVGDTKSVPVDIRLVSATHRDLDDMVARGSFRNDLFARICGYRVTLPALADRIEDLGLLIAGLLPKVAPDRASALCFDVAAARALFAYDWPLNIRELENALATAAVLADGGVIELEHLPEQLRGRRPVRADGRAATEDEPDLTEEQRRHRDELVALFRELRGNVSAVARRLNKDRKQIQRWTKRYGISPDDYR
jgi:transcriptional regulator with PAS, ATPase and Fis domain